MGEKSTSTWQGVCRARARVVLGLGCAALVALAACGSDESGLGRPGAGGLVIQVDSDMAPPKDFDGLRLIVTQAGGTLLDEKRQVGAGHLLIPAEFRLAATTNPAPVEVRAVAYKGMTAIIERLAIVTFPASQLAILRLTFNYLCAGTALPEGGSSCGPGKTCKQGTCAPAQVPELPLYQSPPDAGATDGGLGTLELYGRCFDTVACFGSARPATPEGSGEGDCVLPLPAGADPARVNVALELPLESGGVCGERGCFVVIDHGPDGWALAGTSLRLPAGICRPRPDGGRHTVVLTTSCAAKTPRLPACGPWSPATTPDESPGPSEGACSGPVSRGCGNCGKQSRQCQGGVWSDWSACTGQGMCTPAGMQACGSGGTQACSTSCRWSECGGQTCVGPATQACGNCGTQTRTCEGGVWSAWSPCTGEGVCAGNATEACGTGGTRRCGGNCQWGTCSGQTCDGPASQACGNCGTQTRTCNNGTWSEWSACAGGGECAPNASEACGTGGTRSCGGNCTWGACGSQTCPGPATQACGNCGTQTRTCDGATGMWSAWSACAGEGACAPGASQGCGMGGTQTCGGNCQWGAACTGQICPGGPAAATEACGNCGQRSRTCDSATGAWSDWSACSGTGVCAPGMMQACGSGGSQACTDRCQWGGCTGQMCQGPATRACGNCGMQTRTCDGATGTWSDWGECTGQGECQPDTARSCGSGGTQTCGRDCRWAATCTGQSCPGAPSEACGNCGRRTRTCDSSTGMWSGWSACGGEGVCAPNATQPCGTGGTQICSVQCQWGACGNQMCAGPATQACGMCGTQSRTCNNGTWSDWSTCTGQGVCQPQMTRPCGNRGTQTCGSNCQWAAACTGQICEGPATEACGNCGTRSRVCNGLTGMYGPWSACEGEGACAPSSTRSCGNGGTQTCGRTCQWGTACTGQMCPGGAAAATRACGNCNLGRQTRTCNGNTGQWNEWGACMGEGVCTPGQVETCGGNIALFFRTCTPGCTWGPCCVAGSTACNGQCTNLQTDRTNCGRCGNVCPAGTTCTSGQCTTGPQILGRGFAPWDLALANNRVYWTNNASNGSVASVPIGGGTEATVTMVGGPEDLSVSGAILFFSTGANLWRVPSAGGTATVISTDEFGTFHSLAAVASDPIYAHTPASQNGVYRVLGDQRQHQQLALIANGLVIRDTELHNGFLYWTAGAARSAQGGVVNRVALTAPNQIGTLASGQNIGTVARHPIAVDGVHGYFATADGRIMRAPVGGLAATLFLADVGGLVDLATDGTHLYAASPSAIHKIPIANPAARTPLYTQGSEIHAIAVDATHVYWTDTKLGTVARIAK